MKSVLLLFCVLTAAVQAQTPVINSFTGEGGPSVCPGGVAFVNGTNLGNTSTAVTIGGKAAYVFNGNGTFLQLQIPVDLALGATQVRVGASAPFNTTLVRYCPGVPVDNNVAGVFHYPSMAKVTTAYPASPNEQLIVTATGLGPTNPPVATGQRPDDSSSLTVVKPAVTLGGKDLVVDKAYLSPQNGPGFYEILVTVNADATTGNLPIRVTIGGISSNTPNIAVTTQPFVTSATNAASYIAFGPSRGIAQGAVFVVKGVNFGPKDIVIAAKAFDSTTLSNTSVTITSGSFTAKAPMYYTSKGQLAALLPSNTPVGAATMTVTYNGQTGPAFNFIVSSNTLGIFTVSSDGTGVGIVTHPDYSLVSTTKADNCGGVYTTCGAANPGDVLTIWATGLGAVSGDDTAGSGLGVNQASLPLTVWLGDVAVKAIYQGRSGCCIGEDQIIFTVPANAPLGCAVPLTVQVTQPNGIPTSSNSVALAIAASGSRTCTPVNPVYTTDHVIQGSKNGTLTFGEVDYSRRDNFEDGGTGYQDYLATDFYRLTFPQAAMPFLMSYVDEVPAGSCTIVQKPEFGRGDPPIDSLIPLDPGSQFTIRGPNGTKTIPAVSGSVRTSLSDNGSFFGAGTITLSTSGGTDIPAFTAAITAPVFPVMTSPAPHATTPIPVTRDNGLVVTWTGGTPGQFIRLNGLSATDNTYTSGTGFECLVPAGPGTFTIPARITQAMVASGFGGLRFTAVAPPVAMPGSGLDLSSLHLEARIATAISFR